MKKIELSKIINTTLIAGALSFAAQDLTPNSWQADAGEKKEQAQKKGKMASCSSCSGKKMNTDGKNVEEEEKRKAMKGSSSSCSGKKGSSGSCGANGCSS